jgi:radical SAM family uncharacterized protein/radical SAM-linked protein
LTNHSFLSRVQRPTRYLGRELNAVSKDLRAVSLRVALLFPDLYEVGMSHLGLALLYDILNREPDVWAERAYAPAPDLEQDLRLRGAPLASLESATPLKDFDLVGVSLQYELSYTNFLNMLELGGIPLFAADRGQADPVVLGGGPAAFNPEPVAPFFDAVALGDGEEVILELADALKTWKAAGGSRRELWQALEAIDGVYVPALFEPVFDRAGGLEQIIPRGRRERLTKRVLTDLGRVPLTPRPLVPYCQIVHDRLNVEIARGCSRGCRYCQAGMIYRPVRERDPQAVLSWVDAALTGTGFEEVSLLNLSLGDYSGLGWLLPRLMDRLAPRQVALSLPSLRADTLTPEMVSQIKRVRRTGLTLAPEAGSARLREVINKNLPEETIIASARQAFVSGWRLVKLYFMIGLPREEAADLEEIPRLARQILAAAPPGKRPRLNLSLSTFIPKSHTPFQWERQADLEESRRRLGRVKEALRHKDIQAKWNSASQSWLEGVFSRGDRRLAPVLVAALRLGCRLDAWSEHLRLDLWRQAFAEAGVDPDFYLRERRPEETLPWDHLDSGVSREFLAAERTRAYQGLSTPDCRTAGCQECGVCDFEEIVPRSASLPDSQDDPGPGVAPPGTGPLTWFRLTYGKLSEARWLSHLELISAFYRALRRSGLPLNFSEGFHPLPRASFHGALPVGVESLAEIFDVELTQALEVESVIQPLNQTLPPGIRILAGARLPRRLPPPRPEAALYRVQSPEPFFDEGAASRFLAAPDLIVTRRRPKEERPVDLRRLVARLAVLDSTHLELGLRLLPKDNLKVTEAVQAIFGLSDSQTRELAILKLKSI